MGHVCIIEYVCVFEYVSVCLYVRTHVCVSLVHVYLWYVRDVSRNTLSVKQEVFKLIYIPVQSQCWHATNKFLYFPSTNSLPSHHLSLPPPPPPPLIPSTVHPPPCPSLPFLSPPPHHHLNKRRFHVRVNAREPAIHTHTHTRIHRRERDWTLIIAKTRSREEG